MNEKDNLGTGAQIEIKGLTVVAGNRVLLENANATFAEGEISLVVGPSGVGKSILMKLIAGLTSGFGDAVQYDGAVTINGQKARSGDAGVVFQSFALFDELGPVDNIKFAKSCGKKQASKVPAKELLDQLNVPTHVPTSRLSGGQRQRLAIARTLAYNPTAILFDEPTSGLDPFTGKQVAELIAETHSQFGKTSVIVTHDYHSLMPIADRIFLLHPQKKKLVEIAKENWQTIPDMLAPMASKVRQDEEVSESSRIDRLAGSVKSVFDASAEGLVAFGVGLLSLLPLWKTPTWGARSFAHFLRMVTGPTAVLYLVASGFISGFVTTYFTFKFLPYTDYTKPLLLEDLLTALGFATYRIFVPVLSCVLIAARCGAAVTSDIGGRQYGNQIDALVTFLATHPQHSAEYWHQFSMRGLEVWSQYFYKGFGWLIGKLLVSGFGTAVIAYRNGMAPKYSSADVSRSVTSTILWSTLYVLVVHFVFSLFEFENIVPGGK